MMAAISRKRWTGKGRKCAAMPVSTSTWRACCVRARGTRCNEWARTMTNDGGDIKEALDWQGKEVRCDACVHIDLLAVGRCRPMHTCVSDCYARRIDRCLYRNPRLARDYLSHPYFEVRAIAAKHVDVFHLPALLNDPDESVRWSAALRLPSRFLLPLRDGRSEEQARGPEP